MEGYYSSDGSTSFFTSEMPDFTSEMPDVWGAYGWDERNSSDHYRLAEEKNEISSIDGGLTDSLTDQEQLNQVETSEASYQTRSRGGSIAKLTPAERKEHKRQSDYKYRQKLKTTADEQTAKIKRLKEENERLNAEIRMLKEQMGMGLLLPSGQLPAVAPQRQDSYITQSTGKQLGHQRVSAQNHHGTNSGAADRQMIPVNGVPTNDYEAENQKNSQAGRCCNDDAPITDLLKKIDADDESKVEFSDFTGLDGNRITVGKYSFPLSLLPTVKRIIDARGDVSATSKMNPKMAEGIYIMFCASVKEMNDLQLEQVTEGRILKWRDAIRDALRINFEVDFAMEHLKKIACAFIGLTQRRKLENVAMRISKLEAELSAGKEEHAKICEQSKLFMESAENFIGKPVSSAKTGLLTAKNRHLEEHLRWRQSKNRQIERLSQSIVQYRHEMGQILASINITTQHYSSIEAENSVLRAQHMELSERLRSLNEIIRFFNLSNDAENAKDAGLP